MQPPYPVFLSWADRLGESGGWRSLSQTERWRTPRTRPSVPCRPAWPCPPPSRTWTSRSPPPHSSSQADSRYHTDCWGRPWPVPAPSAGRGTTCWLDISLRLRLRLKISQLIKPVSLFLSPASQGGVNILLRSTHAPSHPNYFFVVRWKFLSMEDFFDFKLLM